MAPFFFLSMASFIANNTKLSDWLLELFQPTRLWLNELPCDSKWIIPSERAMKTESETGVKSVTPFCWGLSLGKTNSACSWYFCATSKRHFLASYEVNMPLWHGTESKQTKQWKGHILVVDTFVPHQKGGKNFKAVLLKMAFACMWYFWKFPNELGKTTWNRCNP